MFERGKPGTTGALSVEIALSDGRQLLGILVVPLGRSLVEVLNGTSSFIEFKPSGGERMFIARSALHSVKPMDLPPAPDLWAGPTEGGGFDPYAILGIKRGANRDEVRQAYFGLAKIYHPDRYASMELPAEVREYLAVMARRINAAHDALGLEQKKQAAKQDPLYTTSA